ncbi:hypothetical protein HGB07_07070, partial [Candidatus Roizmanbacteria bacterium]|nr:hypothetical protein [Candidatus Roizmanbacteria bacterium]
MDLQVLKAKVAKIVKKIKAFTIKKIHLEYITAVLSIPVLVTAIIINVNNLTKKDVKPTVTPTPQIINVSDKYLTQNQGIPTSIVSATSQVCQKRIGPISISEPIEGQTITDNPLCFAIDYSDTNYCSV